MPEWSISVTAVAGRPLSDADIDRTAEELSPHGVAIGVDPGGVTLQFDVAAPSRNAAIGEGLALITRTAPALEVKRIDTQTVEELERELETDHTDYAGLAEAAQILGVSRQRASAIAKRPGFPAPVGVPASGPIWRGADVRRFAAGRVRRPGRPRKARVELRASASGAPRTA